jgi:hypothetical protein
MDKKPVGRPRKEKKAEETIETIEPIEKIEKERRTRVYRLETEEERILSKKKAKEKYNQKKLYLVPVICSCGCEITAGNKKRHESSQKHILLLQLKSNHLESGI